MNKSSRIISWMLFLAVLTAAPSVLAQADKLVGVWTITEVRIPEIPTRDQKGQTITNPQPNIYIFTPKYFSIQEIHSDKPRTDLPGLLPFEDATDAQLVAAWKPFNAASGTYEVKESTILTHIMVSKDPNFMNIGASRPMEFRFEGETLLLTIPLAAFRPDSPKWEYKLNRLE